MKNLAFRSAIVAGVMGFSLAVTATELGSRVSAKINFNEKIVTGQSIQKNLNQELTGLIDEKVELNLEDQIKTKPAPDQDLVEFYDSEIEWAAPTGVAEGRKPNSI